MRNWIEIAGARVARDEFGGVDERRDFDTLSASAVRGSHVQKLVAEIMAAWRRAERLAATLPEDSPEHDAAARACERLRDAYQELTHSGVADALTAAEARMLLADAASDVGPG
jgi:hypothetical protein